MKARRLVRTSIVLCALTLSQVVSAADLECTMRFSLSGWSVIYKHTSGKGVVTCKNGQTMKVKIETHGGGLTAGKSRIDNGVGNFSDINKISDVLGTYAQADASAGAVKSGTAQVLTKGEVSLALSGAGQGIDLGISVGGLTISEDK
ncbi:hypothetical protein [Dyella jiangningensis]|uniref:Uncharacterized protein n=1 Tax=Dyella jiangningensis TaxID=1379159 RepID=A0A328P8P0_9GAMM|nr:hypothetical protein [Dyella jiangningensis]RAO77651.1 hypothetical protein CA260_07245 [Dyella jiangningensis]